MLSHAYTQLNNTNDLIANSDPVVAHIPSHLQRVGLIVTMEPFAIAIANSKPVQDLLQVSPNLPTNVCASDDLEGPVTLQSDVGEFLLNFLADPEKPGCRISTGLAGMLHSRNSVLDKAWENYSWGPPADLLNG